MVGKALVPRLLELAGERMRPEEQVRQGDAAFPRHGATLLVLLIGPSHPARFAFTLPSVCRQIQRKGGFHLGTPGSG